MISSGKNLIQLMKILKPLIPHMMLTILLGTLGYLAVSAISLIGGMAFLDVMGLKDFGNGRLLLIMIITAGIMRAVFRLCEQYMTHYIAFRLLATIRFHIFRSLGKLGNRQLMSFQKGELMNVITKDVEMLEVFYAHTVAPVCISFITGIVYLAIFWSFHPFYAVAALFSYLLISYVVPKSVYRSGQEAGEAYRVQFGMQSQYILDRLKGLKELYIFGQEQQTINQIDEYSEELNNSTLSLKKHEGLLKALTDGALYLSVFIQIGISIYLYGIGKVDAGTGLLAMLLLYSSFGPALALSQLSSSLVHTFASAKRVLGIMNITPEVNEGGSRELVHIGNIKYKDVQFEYEKGKHLYKNVNFEWRIGEIIGIRGDNGTGKSTLISLLLRDIPVTKGTILLNGVPAEEYDADSYRNHFSMVDAHTIVFSDTLRRNLTMYKKYKDEEIWDACEKAGLYQFIKSLPEGLDTHLQEFGENLSSGQLQRLALARLFLDDASVFILDEPTTNLDALNESSILQAIKAHAGDKLVILISHHPEVLAMADRIFEVSNGQINEMECQHCKNA